MYVHLVQGKNMINMKDIITYIIIGILFLCIGLLEIQNILIIRKLNTQSELISALVEQGSIQTDIIEMLYKRD